MYKAVMLQVCALNPQLLPEFQRNEKSFFRRKQNVASSGYTQSPFFKFYFNEKSISDHNVTMIQQTPGVMNKTVLRNRN